MHYVGIRLALKYIQIEHLVKEHIIMDEKEILFHEKLILLNYEAESKEELLKNMSKILREQGYVKDSFAEGVLQREIIYPTGLNTAGVKVAIPHTDAIHVEKPAILVALLNKAVSFKEMGGGVNDVEAKLIFMLAIKNPSRQVQTLGKLMSIFSDKDKLLSIYNSTTTKEVIDKLSQIVS
ncbi:PTS sugar transporter subunit IIA [Clostridium sp.]|uniref:PTS sugar transporter subunit IIA n=1 Tax=Clostridium sp. TaxID=1506 RepID=UPI003D6D6376